MSSSEIFNDYCYYVKRKRKREQEADTLADELMEELSGGS